MRRAGHILSRGGQRERECWLCTDHGLDDAGQTMGPIIDDIRATICSRCGVCDALCSKQLPVSWLFRDAYITHYSSETFETVDEHRYFKLHPWDTAACSTCS